MCSLVVRLQQPASGFAKTVLERQRYPALRAGEDGQPRRPYDVTAHTLPLLLGVEVDTVAAPFSAELEPLGAQPRYNRPIGGTPPDAFPPRPRKGNPTRENRPARR